MSRPLSRPGIGDVGDGERVGAEQLIGLAEQHVDEAGAVELRGVLHADIRPAAAFGAVPAGELVDAEQIAVVEDQALRILVRQLADELLVRAHDDLGDRLDRLRAPRLHVDEGIAVLDAGGRHGAHFGVLAGGEVVRDAGLVFTDERGGVAAQRQERREDLADRIGDAAASM